MERTDAAARLQRLISAYQPELFRVCYFCLQDRMLAEDAVQETFMRVWRKLDSYSYADAVMYSLPILGMYLLISKEVNDTSYTA